MTAIMNKLKKLIDKQEIISFDIFDTLLLRPYMNPDDLFEHMGQLYNIPDFRKYRNEAFLKAVEKYCKDGIQEVTHKQIYEFMPKKYKGFIKNEQDFEYNTNVQNKEIYEVYKYALRAGKRVIFVSDMYLPTNIIKKMLNKNGYNDYFKLYLSSEIKKLKFTGDLYKHVVNDLIVSPSKILHIGDSLESDVNASRRVGLNAFLYPKVREKFLQTNKHARVFYDSHPKDLTTSIIFGLMSIYNNQKQNVTNYWHNLGFKYAGPFVYSYMKWLQKEITKDNIKELLFVARDGYTLEKVFNIIQRDNKKIKTHYIYAPRELMLMCTLNLFSRQRNEKETIDAINSIIEFYKKETDIQRIQRKKLHTLQDYKEFYSENIKTYQKLAAKQKNIYEQYLYTNIPNNCKRCGMVDLGTVYFTAHSLMHEIFKDSLFFKGYYFWATDNRNFNYSFVSKKAYHVQLVELLCTSPEPPIKTLKDNKPIYKKINTFERQRAKIYPDISNGAIEFAKMTENIFGSIDIPFNYNIILEYINSFQNCLQKEDLYYFNKIYCSVDVGHKNYSPIFEQKTIFFRIKKAIYNKIKTNHEKIIKTFGLSLYHRWNYEYKRKKLAFLGGIIQYKQKGAFVFDLRFCGIRILRKSFHYNEISLYLFGIKFSKKDIKNILLRKIVLNVGAKHDDIYLSRYHIGETYVYLAHLQDWIKNNNSKNPVIVVYCENYLNFYKMFVPSNVKVKYINLKDFDVYNILNQSIEIYKDKRIFCTMPYIALNMKALRKKHKKTNFYKYICDDIGNVGKMQTPLLEAYNKENKPYILICPEAASLSQLPKSFWDDLIVKLQARGYGIYINSFTTDFCDKDVTILRCDISELCRIAKASQGIISMASGLAVLLSFVNRPMTLLYSNWSDMLLTSKETLDFYSLSWLPNVDKKNIYEYDTENISLDSLTKQILRQYKKI